MKKALNPFAQSIGVPKIDLKMKLSLFFLVITMFSLQANTAYSQKTKISLSMNNVTMSQVIDEIEVKTEFKFIFNTKALDLKRLVSINVEHLTVDKILEKLFNQTKTTFEIDNKKILLRQIKANKVVSVDASEVVTSQDFQVNGVVTDETGAPLPGASIVEKGTTNGTQTDFDGKFSLNVVDQNAILLVSYIGFIRKEVPSNSGGLLSIILKEDSAKLEEVIVVGYGTQKKSDITGSIASVKSEDFNQGVVTNPGQLLQGKLAGVNVAAVSGEPGAAQNIIVRGVGSLRSGTTPLFVIDGFPIDNSTTGLDSNPLNFINPQDIASMDVLKDASATAIYGARAANGVIVITTKKGETGKTKMNLSVSTAIANLSNKIDVFSASEFRQQVSAVGGTLDDQGGNTDWQDALTRTAVSKNINFSMSGGASDKFSYFVSTGFDNQEGILENSSLKRYSGRVNLNQKALDGRFNVDFNLTASRVLNERSDDGSAENTVNEQSTIIDMLQLNPTIPVFTDGEPTFLDERLNPVLRNEIYSDLANQNRILANISPSFEIIKGLRYKASLGVDYSLTTRDQQQLPYALLEGSEDGFLNTFTTSNSTFLIENTITYSFDKGKHNVVGLAGHSYQETNVERKELQLEGFALNGIEPRFQDQISTELLPTSLNSEAFTNELQSFFGRVQYAYDSKYLLTATMRADGSSKFGKNNKYGYFPSIGLGWNIHKENFMADNTLFTNLKLRASWGQTGNQDGIDSKVSLASFVDSKSDNDTYPLDSNASTLDGYPFGTVAVRTDNPDLKWEVATQATVGLDFGLINNRLTGSFDYFNKVTSDVVLFAFKIDPIQPTDKFWTNIEDMEIHNSGIEFALDYNSDFTKDFSYNIGGNIAYTNNKVVNSPYSILTTGSALGAGQTGATINGYLNNEPVGTFYIKEFIGIGDDGKNQFRDVVADGQDLDNDRIAAGSALPDIIYAFFLNFKYKQLSLGLNFNGVSGNKIYNHTAMTLFGRGQLSRSLNTTDFATEFSNEDLSNSNEVSTRYLEDGSYLRLNNATLAYTLNPKGVFGDVVNGIRFSLTGQNLFVISDYSGFDPEVNTGSTVDGIQTFGIDRFTYPTPRTFLLGLNVSF
ncbi:TonB-dependent receptor [Cellulophaga sp. HaHaR_3_176]|uniref:TonB-dependent receptor n=1 Tax=Cellulophaga sp. HaHaR_3_176 TaxID=1942464 RepID=UPI0020B13EAD|nr:TonB-dependent receptor [Cellulophaga sp. HaHaR_3_176]